MNECVLSYPSFHVKIIVLKKFRRSFEKAHLKVIFLLKSFFKLMFSEIVTIKKANLQFT